MGTVTVTPVIPVALPPIQRAETWVKQHEKIALALIAGLVLWFGIGRIDTLIQNHDNANLAQAKIVAQQAADRTEAVAAQVAEQAAQYKLLAAQVTAQNAALVAANTQLATALAKQQKTDATLPPSDLVARWNTLVPQAKPTVTPTGVAMDTPSAVATVQQLELVPAQQQELKNTQQELSNAQSLVSAEGQSITVLNTEVSDLRTQSVADAKVCTDQIAVVKAEARKSNRRWFIGGFIAGFLSRQAIKTYIGI